MTHPAVYLTLFLLAALYDALALMWMHYSSRNALAQACVLSMLVGAVSLVTIGQGIQGWAKALVIILGYGAGTLVTVWVKGRYAHGQ